MQVKNYKCHKNKIRTNETKTSKNNKNNEAQSNYVVLIKKKCTYNFASVKIECVKNAPTVVVLNSFW